MKRQKGYSAWLVTWEWSGEHARREQKIAEVLDPRTPAGRVRHLVELLYHTDALLREKIDWRLRKLRQIYPAKFLKLDGLRWQGEIICGHNPWLRARLVDNLIVETDAHGKETAAWQDRDAARKVQKVLKQLSR